MKIIMLRHAETDINKNGKFQGCEIDPDINQTGEFQSRCTARYLKDNYEINKMYCSNMQRAKSTINIISDFINFDRNNIIYTCKLKESCKEIANKTDLDQEAKKKYKKILSERANDTLNEIIKSNNKDDNILIVSHGAIIKSLIKKIMDVDEIEKNVVTEVGNCTLTIFEVHDYKFKKIKCYDNSHLNS
mgnify:CR=1 FL=1